MTYVVGLDTAGNRLHMIGGEIGSIDPQICACGPLTGKRWSNPDDRRQMLYESAKEIFAGLPRGAHIFCEEPLALTNGKTTRILSLACGAIWAAHLGLDLFWHWVDVVVWKREIVGRGNADKERIAEWVITRHGFVFTDEDSYDAFCLRLYGVNQLKGQ